MRWTAFVGLLFIVACGAQSEEPVEGPAEAQEVPVRELFVSVEDGGSVVTDLGYGIRVNDGSDLRRSWITIDDPEAPIALSSVGVNTRYRSGDGYSFVLAGELVARKAVAAYDLSVVLFDLFGERLEGLSGVEAHNVAVGESIDVSGIGSWYASENDVGEYLTSVTFLSSARMQDGTVWKADREAVVAEISELIAGGLAIQSLDSIAP